MLPDPLHPAIVHLPIALAALIPGLAILALALIQKGVVSARSWAAIVLLHAILLGSSWLAMETGEEEEDRVEHIVAERHIEAHEEAAERFLVVVGLSLLVTGAGLLGGPRGHYGRIAGTLAALVVLGTGVSVGHTGGDLVYKHGAANAYLQDPGASGLGSQARRGHDDD